LAWFRTLANDEHPRVRLEAVRAASFFDTAEAADLALEVLRQPMDYYLEYALRETLRQLEPLCPCQTRCWPPRVCWHGFTPALVSQTRQCGFL